MNKDIKNELHALVVDITDDYRNATDQHERGKAYDRFLKGVSTVKEIDAQAVDNSVKRKKIRIDESKLELDESKLELERQKIDIELKRLKLDNDKFDLENDKYLRDGNFEELKLELENARLEFEKTKFDTELEKAKADKLFNTIMRGIEIGVPLAVYGGLSILSLKAMYKDDGIVPSSTWNFIKGVFKR